MSKVCTACGAGIPEDSAFCTACGAKAPQTPVTQSAAALVQPLRPEAALSENPDKTVSTGAFFGLILLFCLPVIGWIACLLAAFVPKNRNIRNFARAMLIWLVIGLVIGGLITLAVTALARTAAPYVEQMLSGTLEELEGLGEYSQVFEQLGSLSEVLEALEGVAPETVPGS